MSLEVIVNMKDTTDQNLDGLTVGSLAVIGARGGAGASDLRAPACSTPFDSKKWCPDTFILEPQSTTDSFVVILPHNHLDKSRMTSFKRTHKTS